MGTKRSCIRELFAYGQARVAEMGPEAVCDFSLGNPATPPPESVRNALTRLSWGADPMALHGYTSAEGALSVRRAIARDLNERFGGGVTEKDLFITSGAAPALTAVFSALTVSPKTEFIAVAPYFPEYGVFCGVGGASLKVLPAEKDFSISAEALAEAIGENTQGVIINSPNNPSGAVYSEENLRRVAEVLTQKSRELGHPVYLICDEPYRELVYDGEEVPYLPAIYGDTVVCYSYSKSLSLPGDRIGYVLIPPTVGEHDALYGAVAGAARGIGHVCASSTYQALIQECVGERPDLEFYDVNRRLLYEGLTQIGYECVYPKGAFYLFCRAPEGDGAAFSERAKKLGVLIVPGAPFGCPEYVRIAYCVSPETIRRSMPLFRELWEQGK